jgi:hypothetical protein
LKSEMIQVSGDRHVCRTFAKWFALSAAAKTPRPTPAQRRASE